MGALVDLPALVVAGGHRPELLELAKAALDGVAVFVVPGFEGGRPAARTAPETAVVFLVSLP